MAVEGSNQPTADYRPEGAEILDERRAAATAGAPPFSEREPANRWRSRPGSPTSRRAFSRRKRPTAGGWSGSARSSAPQTAR